MFEMTEKVEEKVFKNPHREKGGCKARNKRGDMIKENMEDDRAFRSLKTEQGIRSGRAMPEIFMFHHIY